MKHTTALILCGGLGTRLRPWTYFTPKPLLKVGGKCVIDYIWRRLVDQDILDIYMDVHYLAWKIIRHVGWRAKFSYGPSLLGTAGAIGPVLSAMSDPFFVLNGDTITNVNFKNMLRCHQEGIMTIFTKDTAVHNGGVFLIDKNLAWNFCFREASLHEDVIPSLPKESIQLFDEPDSYYFDIGTPEKLKKARQFFGHQN